MVKSGIFCKILLATCRERSILFNWIMIIKNISFGRSMNRTAQREAILKELRSVKSHPTADELYTMLRVKMPTISLGTVYRNLEQMSQAGIVRKLETAGKQKRFDGDLSEHHHVRCPVCGAVRDVSPGTFDRIDREIRVLMRDLQCDSFYLELSGKCRVCSRNKDQGGENAET